MRKTMQVNSLIPMGIMVVTVLVFTLGGVPLASAETFVCTKTIGTISVDTLVVPAGKTCTLNGTKIKGNVIVNTNATLSASAVQVGGNIQAEGAKNVYVNPGSIVEGNVQIKQGGGARIERVVIDGDLQFEQNAKLVVAKRNTVNSNLQVFGNTGGVTLLNNMIAENLQCKENTPPPTGGGNIAGKKEDQCAKL